MAQDVGTSTTVAPARLAIKRFRWWTTSECQAPEVIVLAHDDEIAISRTRPNRLIAGAAHTKVFDVLAVWPVRGEFSHKTGTQILIEEEFHTAV
jgi:hypothetical protein